MSTATQPTSREEIQKAFSSLVKAHDRMAAQITTKAEEAARAEDKQVVDRASGYTVKNIINGLAQLQLEFGANLETLADRMESESNKLDELQRAIKVESERLAAVKDVTVAAEALAILKQDHARRLAEFEEEAKSALSDLEEEMSERRAEWAREQAEHEADVAAYEANLKKEREQAEADHAYELARQDKLKADDNAAAKRDLERELADTEATKERDWAAREKQLDAHADEIAALRTKIENMPAILEKAETSAREKAIKAVNRDAAHAAQLLERQLQSDVEVYELKIKTLEDRIGKQAAQIEDLSQRLSAALEQAQNLATEALKGSHK